MKMKMFELLAKIAKDEIEGEAVVKFKDDFDDDDVYYTYDAEEQLFYDKYGSELSNDYEMSASFLNIDVEYILPKNMLYIIKLEIRGLADNYVHLNRITQRVFLDHSCDNQVYQAHFTKKDMKNIQTLREFLEDVEGKYALIKAF